MKNNQISAAPVAPSFNDRMSITETMLPSRGMAYLKNDGSTALPGGSVRISSMTVAEEKMMSQKNADPARKVCQLLDRVCDLHGMKAENLLVADQFYLLMRVRALSYGSSYGFQYRCSDCEHQWKHTINLETDLTLSVVDDEWQEPMTVDLPISGKTVTYRMLRVSDEIQLNNKKIRKGDANEDPTFVAILARCIVAIDGETVTSPRLAEAWLEKQVVQDRAALTNHMHENTPGYSGDIEIECPKCGYLHEAAVPMTSDFFRSDVPA